MKRRFLRMLLALVMVLSLLPMTALAAEDNSCGDGVTWSFNEETGTLTISGSGAMTDYSVSDETDSRPWSTYKNQIAKVEIGAGVTEIGECAFMQLSAATIEFEPNSNLKIIANSAFRGNTALTSIQIPKSVETIEGKVFRDCTGLQTVTFETGSMLKSLGGEPTGTDDNGYKDTFVRCTALQSIQLPDSLEEIGPNCFADCTMLTSICIPDNVSYIGPTAFRGSGLTSFHIPSSLTKLSASMLGGTKITELEIPDEVTEVGVSLCSGCTELRTVTIGSGVQKIDYWVFKDCTNLETVVFSALTDLNAWTFAGCSSLKMIVNYSSEPMKITTGTLSNNNYANWKYDPYYSATGGVTTYLASPVATGSDVGYPEHYLLGLGQNGTASNPKHNVLYIGDGQVNTEKSAFDAVTNAGYIAEWYTDSGFKTPVTDTDPAGGRAYYAKWTLNAPTSVTVSADKTTIAKSTGTATLTASAGHELEGVTYKYQWYNGDPKNGGSEIEGAAEKTYKAEKLTDDTTYYCVVTAEKGSDKSEATTSNAVTIFVANAEGRVTISGSKTAATYGDGPFTFTYTASGTAAVKSSDSSVATVSDNNGTVTVTIVGVGSTTISVSSAASADYTAASDSFVLTVAAAPSVPIIPQPPVIPTAPVKPVDPTPTPDPVVNPFVDVPASAYYYDAVLWAVENGVTGGMTATTFSPNAACTRAQAVTFLWRAAGSPAPRSSVNPFTDVQPSAYYYEAVLWAVENGVTTGTTATTFSPDDTCTRNQAVTFLWRAVGSPVVMAGNPFADVADDAYYAPAVLWAVRNGVTTGTSANVFSPSLNCARGQIVTFLYRTYAN